jgi:hypothetical protein
MRCLVDGGARKAEYSYYSVSPAIFEMVARRKKVSHVTSQNHAFIVTELWVHHTSTVDVCEKKNADSSINTSSKGIPITHNIS